VAERRPREQRERGLDDERSESSGVAARHRAFGFFANVFRGGSGKRARGSRRDPTTKKVQYNAHAERVATVGDLESEVGGN